MKKTYSQLEIEIITFEKKDVVTASLVDGDNTYSLFSSFRLGNDFLTK